MFSQSIIYKIADFLQNPIEFRNPFGITPFELKAGSQILSANSIGFDSTETELDGFKQLYNRYIKRRLIPKGISILNYGYIIPMIPNRYISILKIVFSRK